MSPGRPPDTAAPVRNEPLPAELANSEFADRGLPVDALTSPAELAGWLHAHRDRFEMQLSAGDLASVTEGQLRVARTIRAAVRSLPGRAGPPSRAALAALNEAVAVAPRFPQLRGSPPRAVMRSTATAVDAALGQIAEETMGLLLDARAEIRQCAAPGCVLLYVRRGGRRAWCSAECGNRARVLRHYERHSRRAR